MNMRAPAFATPVLNPGHVSATDLERIASITRPLKARIRALLELQAGQRVLDVGCGPGLDAAVAAARLGPDGLAVGLDYDSSLLGHAQQRTQADTPHAPVWVAADAAAIPHIDDVFDGTYCERVLQHCSSPEGVIREMVRVTRPGGVVLAADTDWATLSIDTPDTPATVAERGLVRFVGDTLRNGYAGRQLRRLLVAQHLDDIDVELWPIVWTSYDTFRATSLAVLNMDDRAVREGAVTRTAFRHLHDTLAAAERAGAFFATAAVVIARGRKPRSMEFPVSTRRTHGA